MFTDTPDILTHWHWYSNKQTTTCLDKMTRKLNIEKQGVRRLAAANIHRLLAGLQDGLPPGHMRLYPSFPPTLPPGRYGIEVKQSIDSSVPGDDGKLDVFNYDSTSIPTFPPPPNTPILLQEFQVIAPQFNLDPKVINSHYPPDGHSDQGNVLPHIVFNDPHIPWDRFGPQSRPSTIVSRRVRTPWIAVLVFAPDELKLDTTEASNLGIPDASFQTATTSGAFNMKVGEFLTTVTTRLRYEAAYEDPANDPEWQKLVSSTDSTSVIFPKYAQARDIFKEPIKFILLSHVREINTVGFPDAGTEEKGMFSVCVSHMTGDPNATTPKTQIAHLVSIEMLETFPFNAENSPARIGLVSLYSWTFLAVPPDPVNFKDIMTNLAATKGQLRPSDKILNSIPASLDPASPEFDVQNTLLLDRLQLGYSLRRWRASTGEETISFSRGPLTPSRTPWPPVAAWPGSSNTGKDYQILDRSLGVMDLTYSSAWQLGKLMAISDGVFSSALLRFRSLVHKWAANQARIISNGLITPSHLLSNLTSRVESIDITASGGAPPARNLLPTNDTVAPAFSHSRIAPIFSRAIKSAVTSLTGSGDRLYNDYSLGSADNSDWEIVHNWISDKLFLGGIPAQYLITDPTHLPSEALRFFYIDDAWVDCFIDGALSTANHLDPIDDQARRRIKDAYNTYLSNTIHPSPVKPPVPRFGFFVRSELIRVMPDIRIVVRCRKMGPGGVFVPDESRAPLVRLTKLNDTILLALLDCMPEDLFDIRFIQPPHQQRFIIPTTVRQLYTSGAPPASEDSGEWPPVPAIRMPTVAAIKAWYNSDTRCLEVAQAYVDMANALSFSDSTQSFVAGAIDSAIFALELNDSNYQISILPPDSTSPNPAPASDRQLWVGEDVSSPIPLRRTVRPASFARKSLLFCDEPTSKEKSLAKSFTGCCPNTQIPTIHQSRGRKPLPKQVSLCFSSLPIQHTEAPLSQSTRPRRSQVSKRLALSSLTIPGATPQFRLIAHPDNRGAAPLPDLTDPSSPIYSAFDYIPTDSLRLINLIFSIQRQPSPTPFSHRLSSLTVTVPITTSPAAASAAPSEPLLVFASSSSPSLSVRMLHNKYLIPFLSISSTTSTLQIKMTPRWASRNMASSIEDALSVDASFLLTACDIAAIKTKTNVEIYDQDGLEERGICKVGFTETYVMDDGSEGEVVGEAVVLKKAAQS